MNILIMSWRGPGHPHAGGAEESTHQHAKGWIRGDHDVTLFTSFYPGAKTEETIDGIKIVRQGSQIFGVHLRAFIWYVFGCHIKFDLVIDQFHGIPFFIPIYVKEKKLAFIHEVTKEVWRLNPLSWPFNLIPALIGTLFEPFIFKLLYKNIPFMTVSDSTRNDLIEWGIPEKNITTIHNGLEKPKGNYDFPKEKNKTLIFLGALSKDKGIEDALRVFSILSKKNKSFRFWVVGKAENHYLIKLISRAKKLNIYDKTKFYGFVEDKEKYKLLARAHIIINTSAREGWGLVVIEGAYVGTPTVGYNVAGLKDSIINGKTGVLCDSNPAACAQEVVGLMNNSEKYENMQNNCKEWSKKFNWEISSKESLKLISKIIHFK